MKLGYTVSRFTSSNIKEFDKLNDMAKYDFKNAQIGYFSALCDIQDMIKELNRQGKSYDYILNHILVEIKSSTL